MDETRRLTRRQQIRLEHATQNPVSYWTKILLAIPKNLVYIFVGIVLFAFLAMCYITYTEQNLQEFLMNTGQEQEVTVVDPLFTSLKKSLI